MNKTKEEILEKCFPVIGAGGIVGWHQIGEENQQEFYNAMQEYTAPLREALQQLRRDFTLPKEAELIILKALGKEVEG